MRIVFWTLLFLALSQPAQSRLAKPSDFPAVLEVDNTEFDVNADGTYKMIRELRVLVMNEKGREAEAVQNLRFNGRASEMRVLVAKTINGDGESHVEKKNIEVKEMGDSKAFDAQKQMIISFPNVQIGSRVYFKYEQRMKEVPHPGFWSQTLRYDLAYVESFGVVVRSARPLYYWKNDPQGFLEFTATKEGGRHVLRGRSVRPIATDVTEEEYAYQDSRAALFMTLSTLEKWDGYGRETIEQQEKLLAAPLPAELKAIRDEVASLPMPEKLDAAMVRLSERFRYFGDWRRINGGFLPRPLAEIAATHYGDCKDLSLAAVAIFRSLGLKADIAWIWRGDDPVFHGAYAMPSEYLFNHAIARVQDGDKVYWLDGTNPVSFAKGIFEDIADRPAYVLNKDKAFFDNTPPLLPGGNRDVLVLRYEVLPDRTVQVTGETHVSGRPAIFVTRRNLYNTPESVNYQIVQHLANSDKVLDYSIGEFDRKSRVVKDMAIPFKFRLVDLGMRTSAGAGFTLWRDKVVKRLLIETKERKSDLLLTYPIETETTIDFVNARRVGTQNLDCDLKSPWVRMSRKVVDTAKGARVSDRLTVLKDTVTNAELTSPEFAKFQAKVRECFYWSALILKTR